MAEKKTEAKSGPPEKPSTSKLIYEKARAGYAALYLVSAEDMRSLREIKQAAAELKSEDQPNGRRLFVWTFGKGLIEDGVKGATPMQDSELPPGLLQALPVVGVPRAQSPTPRGRAAAAERGPRYDPSIVVLRLGHHFLDDPLIQSGLLDIIPDYKMSSRMLIILTPVMKLPPEIEKEFALVETQLPGKQQIMVALNGIIEGSQLPKDLQPSDERKEELVEAALGLTTNEAENALSLSIIRPRIAKTSNIWDPRIVMEEKCQALRKSGLLEYIPAPANGLNDVGGLTNLKSWMRQRKHAFTQRARDFGLPEPKGILLVGPAGCGKSLTAKAASAELNVPLLKLDMGKMFGSLVGQSEANIRNAIQIAEAISPCILWIDEMEKGMAGSSAGALDSGVGARVLGTILTWMQEKKSPVFVFATANDVTALPPELLRKGRFDEMFSVDLPTRKEREEILAIHIRKLGRNKLLEDGKLDLKHFSRDTTKGFSGAEIEAGIVEAMYSAFDANKDLNPYDLQEAFDNTQPLSKTMAEKIQAIRAWCQVRTRPANEPEESETQTPSAGRQVQA